MSDRADDVGGNELKKNTIVKIQVSYRKKMFYQY